MEIVVFGAGSLGSLVGGVLARDHDVTLVGRERHVRAIEKRGLRIEGAIEAQVDVAATTDGTGLTADLVVVTVKAFDTVEAAKTLETGSFDATLSLQNGMGNEAILARHLDAVVLAGTATYGALHTEPGVVECTGIGEIVLGSHEGGASSEADRVGDAFAAAGLETAVSSTMPRRLWEKLAINAGINAITALADVDNGAIRMGEANELARAATRETARTAREEGIRLSNRVALQNMESVADATAANTSSMRQDVHAGRPTEIDAINGYVVDRAAERGIEVPSNRLLTGLVRTWERGRTLR